MFSSGYCRNRYHPRGAWRRNALFAETILPFASRPRRKGASSPRAARRGRDARKNGGRRRERITWRRWRDEDEETVLFNLGKRRERRREEEEVVRDPPAKGSYYNKFVGDLRSGNNSELRVTLRMCLSLLLFKWEWKATSCAGCDLHLSLFPPLLLYFLSSPARGPGNMEKPFRKVGREPFWKGGEVD